MYMLAAKSFAHYLKPKGFVIVDDGLLTVDKQQLKKHFDSITFVARKDVKSDMCPNGGCWERLVTLANINIDH
jgi:hypothetical protein